MDKPDHIKSALYIIDTIRPEIENGNFRSVYSYVKQLERLAFFVSLTEERAIQFPPPIIRIPE